MGRWGAATHPPGARAGCAATARPARPAPRRSFPSGSRRCPEAGPAPPPPLGAGGTQRASPPPGRPPGSRVSPGAWRAASWAKSATLTRPFRKEECLQPLPWPRPVLPGQPRSEPEWRRGGKAGPTAGVSPGLDVQCPLWALLPGRSSRATSIPQIGLVDTTWSLVK